MSHEATNWAIKQRGLKPAAKILLWHLADCHNPAYGCFPSQEYLAEHAEMSERSVRRHLEELEELGLISRVKVKSRGMFDKTEYTLRLDVVNCPPAKFTTGQNASPPPAKSGTHHRPNCPPNLVREPLKESVINKGGEVLSILTKWCSEESARSFIAYRRKQKGKALTVTAAKRIASTLQEIFNAGHDPDDALGMAEERGWQSIKLEWYLNSKGNGYGNGSQALCQYGNRSTDSGSESIARAASFDRSQITDMF